MFVILILLYLVSTLYAMSLLILVCVDYCKKDETKTPRAETRVDLESLDRQTRSKCRGQKEETRMQRRERQVTL